MADVPKVYILIGAPGSGKSTWGKNFAKGNPDIVYLCPDEFRAKFGWGEGDQSVSHLAFHATRESMKIALADNKDIIIDATNMHRKGRKEFLKLARGYHAKTIAIVFETSKDVLLQRIKKRASEGGRNISEEVVDMMLSKYQRPDTIEFDKVEFYKI